MGRVQCLQGGQRALRESFLLFCRVQFSSGSSDEGPGVGQESLHGLFVKPPTREVVGGDEFDLNPSDVGDDYSGL